MVEGLEWEREIEDQGSEIQKLEEKTTTSTDGVGGSLPLFPS